MNNNFGQALWFLTTLSLFIEFRFILQFIIKQIIQQLFKIICLMIIDCYGLWIFSNYTFEFGVIVVDCIVYASTRALCVFL